MIPDYQCQKYEELEGPNEVFSYLMKEVKGSTNNLNNSDFLLQLKYDGIWAKVIISDGHAKIYSKTGQLKKTLRLDEQLAGFGRLPIVLVGEFMYGSQWSTKPDRAGKLFIFDCLMSEGLDVSNLPYKDRYRLAVTHCIQLRQPFNILPCYAISKLGEFWQTLRDSHEGFIVRRWSSSWDCILVKLKFTVQDDFIITGFNPGNGKYAGTLGSLQLSQYDGEQLVHVMDCSGMDDYMRDILWQNQNFYLNKVCLVTAKGRFHDGSLRHPAFVEIRDDKLPTQCLLKRQSK